MGCVIGSSMMMTLCFASVAESEAVDAKFLGLIPSSVQESTFIGSVDDIVIYSKLVTEGLS